MKLFALEETIEQLEKKNHEIRVLNTVKSGKEAMVYKVVFDGDIAALKLYKNHEIRSFKNTDPYLLGKFVKSPNMRKAMLQKNKIGKDYVQKGWVKREYSMLARLFEAGCSIPKPYEFASNALVMDYLGDATEAATPLKYVELPPDVAVDVFDDVVTNIQLFLENGIVHADLSEYNILYWNKKPYIIDFPQSVNIRENPNAENLLVRDCHNICKFFSKFIDVNEEDITKKLLDNLRL